MPASRAAHPIGLQRLTLIGIMILLACPMAMSQDDALRQAAETLVRVNIFTTDEAAQPTGTVIDLGAKGLQSYRPTIIEWIPSSGIVLDDKGHVLTFVGYRWLNIHARNPRIEVIDAKGIKHPAKLIGIDQSMRVAIVLCDGAGLRKTPLCESCKITDSVSVIMPVVDSPRISGFESARVLSVGTAGNAADGNDWAIRISRPLSVIGAPLLNARNQIIGIIADQESQRTMPAPAASVNIFPVSQLLGSARKIIKAGGDIQTGWLGVIVDADIDSGNGVSIADIDKDSPAYKAGLAARDVLVKWNGASIRDARKFIQIVQDTPIGSSAEIEILRQGKPLKVTALIEARKAQDPRERLVIDFPGVKSMSGATVPDREAPLQTMLGIELVLLTPQLADFLQMTWQPGLFVASVTRRAPFDRAGIIAGDVILDVDGARAGSPQTFFDHVRSLGSGGRLVLRLVRKGVELSKTVQLPRLPAPFRKPTP